MYPNYFYSPVSTTNQLTHTVSNVTPSNNFDNADNKTVRTSNKQNRQDLHVTHGLLNSGESDFLTVQVNVKNRRQTCNPMTVVIPDSEKMKSTEECEIDWPTLPKHASKGHIIPALKNMH